VSEEILHEVSEEILHEVSEEILHEVSEEILYEVSEEILHEVSEEILHEVSEEVLAGWSEVQVDVGCGAASCIDNEAPGTSNKTFFDTGAALGVGSFLFLENLSAYN
jgi:hypothetical protein